MPHDCERYTQIVTENRFVLDADTKQLWHRLETLEPATARRLRGAKLNDGELYRAVRAAECRAAAGVGELDDL